MRRSTGSTARTTRPPIILALIVRTRRGRAEAGRGGEGRCWRPQRWSDFPTALRGRPIAGARRSSIRRSASTRDRRRVAGQSHVVQSAVRRRRRHSRGRSSASRPAQAASCARGSRPSTCTAPPATSVSGTLAPDVFSAQEQRVHGETREAVRRAARRAGAAGARRSTSRWAARSSASTATSCSGSCWAAPMAATAAASYLSPRQAQDLVVNAQAAGRQDGHPGIPHGPERIARGGLAFALRRVQPALQRQQAARRVVDRRRRHGSTTAYTVPDGRDLRREGIRVVNPRVKWSTALRRAGTLDRRRGRARVARGLRHGRTRRRAPGPGYRFANGTLAAGRAVPVLDLLRRRSGDAGRTNGSTRCSAACSATGCRAWSWSR